MKTVYAERLKVTDVSFVDCQNLTAIMHNGDADSPVDKELGRYGDTHGETGSQRH